MSSGSFLWNASTSRQKQDLWGDVTQDDIAEQMERERKMWEEYDAYDPEAEKKKKEREEEETRKAKVYEDLFHFPIFSLTTTIQNQVFLIVPFSFPQRRRQRRRQKKKKSENIKENWKRIR